MILICQDCVLRQVGAFLQAGIALEENLRSLPLMAILELCAETEFRLRSAWSKCSPVMADEMDALVLARSLCGSRETCCVCSFPALISLMICDLGRVSCLYASNCSVLCRVNSMSRCCLLRTSADHIHFRNQKYISCKLGCWLDM